MKYLKNILSAAFILITLSSCKTDRKAEIKTIEIASDKTSNKLNPNANYSKAEFSIRGMTCEMGCAKTIEKKLAKMEGMKSASVDFKNERATVEYDIAKINPESITKTVSAVSSIYSVENMQTTETAYTSN